MRRVGLLAIGVAALGLMVVAQEHAPAPREHGPSIAEKVEHVADEGDAHLEVWKWANFLILSGILGWMVAKHGPAFFRSRTEEIQRGIAEASRVREDAQSRAAKMEARMASLQSEIEHVRAEAKAEMAREAARLRDETEKRLARIRLQGDQEIASLTKRAQKELRNYSAQLAIHLAKQRITQRMSRDAQDALFEGFLKRLAETSPTLGARQ